MNSVLVDTSVWVDHFRHRNPALVDLLEQDRVRVHPLIVGEIACGTPPLRNRTLADLRSLQPTCEASIEEVIDWVDRESLYGAGCGLIDLLLLASALMTTGCTLWTLDKRLGGLAERFAVSYRC